MAAKRLNAIEVVDFGKSGPKVSNLHKGLLYLIDTESITDNDVEIIRARFAPEVTANTFGGVTAEYVGYYQYKLKQRLRDLPVGAPKLDKDMIPKIRSISILDNFNRGNGVVDDGTAAGLNLLLKERGVKLVY